jgi:hypothetical protein
VPTPDPKTAIMRLSLAAAFLGLFMTGLLAGAFEPADFNVVKALLDRGINVTAIPGLAGLVDSSSPAACSIAVGLPRRSSQLA